MSYSELLAYLECCVGQPDLFYNNAVHRYRSSMLDRNPSWCCMTEPPHIWNRATVLSQSCQSKHQQRPSVHLRLLFRAVSQWVNFTCVYLRQAVLKLSHRTTQFITDRRALTFGIHYTRLVMEICFDPPFVAAFQLGCSFW